ncbi:MAG: hypothetical protein AAFY31_19125 [Pseudomonadota bacterium]
MDALGALLADIAQYGVPLTRDELGTLRESVVAHDAPNRFKLLDSRQISKSWVFIASGFAASYYTHQDGRQTLTRFFQPGHLAGNVSSTWSQDYGSDELIAIGDVAYAELPHEYLVEQYMHGGGFGRYIRLKVIDTLRYDKDLLVCQALNDPNARYAFLCDRHPELLNIALKKDVAAFLGVTPQGYSRFLRRKATA